MSLLVKNYLQKTKVNAIDWPTQSPDLNPTENLWGELNLEELERFTKDEWAGMPQETCERLVKNNKRLQAVIQQKGYSADY